MTYFHQMGLIEISSKRLYPLAAMQVTGGGHVLPIWLEEFLSGVERYIALAGESLLKAASAIMGKGASLADCLTAAAAAEQGSARRPAAGLLSRLLNLNR